MSLKPSNYTSLSPFKAWVQQALPAVYDDSLSYTDLLAKMLKYINDLISNNNNLITDMTTTIDYINNYFKGLDVNDAIDAKLDEMVEDGTLSNLIKPFIDNEILPLITNKFYYVTVTQFGAKGDGITNDTESFQNAIDSLTNGGLVIIPTGKYLIDSITLKEGVTLKGVGTTDPSHLLKSSIIYCSGVDNTIIMENSTSIDNLSFYYPNQTLSDDGPLYKYKACIQNKSQSKRNNLTNLLFINPYIAISFDNPHEYLYCNNIRGYALYNGIKINNCSDIDRIDNVHFNYNTIASYSLIDNPNEYGSWTRKEGIAFLIGRSDWSSLNNCFAWGYRYGCKIDNNLYPNIKEFKINNCGFDSCGCGIESNMNGLIISNTLLSQSNSFNESKYNSQSCINIVGGNGVIISNNHLFSIDNIGIYINNGYSIVTNNLIEEYSQKTTNPAIRTATGVHQIIGNTIRGGSNTLYGINIDSGNNGCNISNNSFYNISDNGYAIQDTSNSSNTMVGINTYYQCNNAMTGLQAGDNNPIINKSNFNIGQLQLRPKTTGSSNCLYIDITDNKLKFRDSTGTVHTLI